MTDLFRLDEQIGELLRRELPVPEHREGFRERAAALLTAEGVAREGRRGWRSRVDRPAPRGADESTPLTRVAPRPPRSRRLAVVGAFVFVFVIAFAVGGVAVLRHLGEPTMVLRITDQTSADANNPTAAPATIVATSLVSLDETKALIHELIRAINANDTTAVRKFHAANGWLENDADKTSIQGSVGIADYWRDAHDRLGLRVEAEGDPIPYDRYIAQRVRYSMPESGSTTGILVYQIDTSGQIAHEWITGWVAG